MCISVTLSLVFSKRMAHEQPFSYHRQADVQPIHNIQNGAHSALSYSFFLSFSLFMQNYSTVLYYSLLAPSSVFNVAFKGQET